MASKKPPWDKLSQAQASLWSLAEMAAIAMTWNGSGADEASSSMQRPVPNYAHDLVQLSSSERALILANFAFVVAETNPHKNPDE
ncbi:hypothetical protein L210DRAFT_978881 [Boletus edulis BED1]|uniref:Uncharacterized protein n=1 Tax=Boletus edulis BED1 TaxID=1328754 RepID=A0AAD4C3B7_BOLED|nr:hypothetical protein L210DRAFT_978881 [Boletus edulis BED1]